MNRRINNITTITTTPKVISDKLVARSMVEVARIGGLTGLIVIILTGCGKLNLHGRGERVFKDIETVAPDVELESRQFVPTKEVSLSAWTVSDFYAEQGGVVNHQFTGLYDVQRLISMRRRSTLRHLWKIHKESLGQYGKHYFGLGTKVHLNAPIYYDGTLVSASKSGVILALDVKNRDKIRWEFPIQFVSGKQIKKIDQVSLSYGEDKVFITTSDGQMMALDANTGHLIWHQRKNFPIRAPLKYALGKLYGSSSIGHFFMIDSDTGEDLLFHKAATIAKVTKTHPSVLIGSSVAVAGYTGGNINGFDLNNGQIKWAQDLSQATQEGFSVMSDVDFTPLFLDGAVLAGNINGGTYLMRESDGKSIWERDISISSPIIADGDFAFFIDANNHLVGMLWETGQVKWATKLPTTVDVRMPKYINDNQVIKHVPIIKRGPIMANGKLLVFTNLGELAVFNPNNGAIQGRFAIPYKITDPIVVEGRIYFISYDQNKIVALQ